MNKSSSFEISSETLDKSFSEYQNASNENIEDCARLTVSACSISEIKNPVKKKINELAQLQIQKKMSTSAITNIIPIINDVPGSSITIPNNKRFIASRTEKLLEPQFYVECFTCKEVKLFPGQCCKKDLKKEQYEYFAYLPVETQIKSCLINHFEEIIEYVHRERSDALTDIDDGQVQKEICENHPEQIVLSFTLNIDGGVLAQKSTRSLWPIQLYQNYLPPSKRFAPENVIVAGLFYGQNKPNPFELLFPLLSEFRHLFDHGIKLIRDGKLYDFLPIIIHCCCDLPARALIQNFKCPTGKSACPICTHPGTPNKENGRVYTRYSKQKQASNLRTHSDTIKHAAKKMHGVKGLSCLMALPKFDIIRGVPTDYMHNVLLGALKRLLSIWLGDIKITSTNFKAISKQNQIQLNRRLCELKPYTNISHRPRSLEHRAQFRAIEYKYLLFYYLRYALNNLLEKRYIDHFELLSAAIYLLSKSEVREEEIQLSENMLNQFCDLFESYFGISSVTMNIHLLRHYGHFVRNSGPLWSYSVFAFESNMGVLSRYWSGGPFVIDQIAKKYINSISTFEQCQITNEPKYAINLKTNKYNDVLEKYNIDETAGKTKQILVNSTHYKSIHSNETKSVDYFFLMDDGTVGAAIFYIIKNSQIFVLFQIYDEIKKHFHLTEVCVTERFHIYPFEAIKRKLIYLKFATKEVVSIEPNLFERT